jgi:HD-GYP domain-containing protein (c-di-GMP phosphodiesterase class II)
MTGAVSCATALEERVDGYKPLDVGMLRCADSACVDFYIRRDTRSEPALYCRAGHRWQADQLFGLAEAGVQYVYVAANDYADVGTKMLESVEGFLHRESIPTADRFSMLQLAVSLEVERAFSHFGCGKIVNLAGTVGRQISDLLTSHKALPRDLFRVARHDYATFTHVTNVACFAVLLIERMGFRDQQQLDRVATGGILHDIGKRFIRPEILTKRGPLDRQERDLIETHPQRGYEELVGRPDVDADQLMMVYQHHERLDGSGYPVRILADEIHPWAQALAVVDVFDAMIGRRPYRRPAPAADVLAYLEKKAGTHFNREIVACWGSAMREK